LNLDIRELASSDINLWNRNVLQVLEDERSDDVLGVVESSLSDRQTQSRT
jgi:hypothetical protein